MYKNKDGKVIASLTEVKNKTGDIFAIVDEFGEISLTSYNKIRYKITKVDIQNSVDIAENGPDAKFADTEKRKVATPKLEVKKEPEIEIPAKEEIEIVEEKPVEVEVIEPEIEEKQEEKAENKLWDKTIEVSAWDRENRDERQFSLNAVRPLIS